jgi:hypothetical protein
MSAAYTVAREGFTAVGTPMRTPSPLGEGSPAAGRAGPGMQAIGAQIAAAMANLRAADVAEHTVAAVGAMVDTAMG